MPEAKRKIRDILNEGREVVKDPPRTEPVHPAASTAEGEELVPVSWRVPRPLLARFVEYAAHRKAGRKRPWKHQELFAEALQEYMERHARK
jgi:hypothetical protein